MSAIVFDSLLFEKIWGSDFFKNKMKNTDNDQIGEMWTLSAIKNCETTVINGKYKGKKLSELYNNKSIFGTNLVDKFPILIKLIATSDDLSVQVHPNDDYALRHENSFGKTEGWLVVDKSDNSKIVIGHNAKDRLDFEKAIENKNIASLLNFTDVKKGDFYPIPSGTVHAIGKDLLIIEIQQSSDITYRLYDYDRLDKNGKLRQLHIDKALDVVNYENYNENIVNINNSNSITIWNNNYFSIEFKTIEGELKIQAEDTYLICTVIDGTLSVENINLFLCQSFIIPVSDSAIITGKGKLFITKSKI